MEDNTTADNQMSLEVISKPPKYVTLSKAKGLKTEILRHLRGSE